MRVLWRLFCNPLTISDKSLGAKTAAGPGAMDFLAGTMIISVD